MRIDIYHHVDNDTSRQILEQLHLLIQNQKTMAATLADIQAQNQALIAAVADEDTVIDSAVTLITGVAAQIKSLQDQLAAAIASNDPAAIQAVVDSMSATVSDIQTKKQALADAVAAGTPAAPPTV